MYNNIAYLKGESEFSLIIKLVSKEDTNSIRLDISIISDYRIRIFHDRHSKYLGQMFKRFAI